MNLIYKDFDTLPEVVKHTSTRNLARLREKINGTIEAQLDESEVEKLHVLLGLSDFVAETFIAHPDWISECLPESNVVPGCLLDSKRSSDKQLHDKKALETLLTDIADEHQLHRVLRQFRNKRMVQIACADLLNVQSIEDSLAQVSQLADALIVAGYEWLYRWFCRKYSVPTGSRGPQNLLIIGMGKLGGRELNFSSDIDLIFAYPEKGELEYRNKSMEHQQFFTRLAQKLIAALHQTSADGQVFRVDMRLRPFGDSGPLVASFAALEDYYQEQGREWERYAMVKGRILNQYDTYAPDLEGILRPFVYRRYIDFGVMDSLRKMKQMIRQEVRRRHLHNNIKLGSGGIREVEFILQCLQLIRGGRDKDIQEKSILALMSILSKKELLSREHIADLKESYLYLRKVEHCLQQFSNQQTQQLPDNELDQQRLCVAMGHGDFDACLDDIKRRTDFISQEFDLLIGETPQMSTEDCSALEDLWLLELSEYEAMSVIEEISGSFSASASVSDKKTIQSALKQLLQFKSEFQSRRIGPRGKASLDKLMPILIRQLLIFDETTSNDKGALINRVMQVIKAILRRTAYLELLLENRPAMLNLIKLCSMSEWVAQQLAKFPLLLDELLKPETLNTPTLLEDYPDLLRQQLLRVPEEDLEQLMESLRQFKLSHQLRIAAADLYNAIPVMKVSDHLTWLAEVIIKEAVNAAWRQMIERYGYPESASDDDTLFLVVSYGKLGGLELGYSSDLDLVFLHDCKSSKDTSGPKQIDSRQFYAKLAQRVMHLFNTKTSSGDLYEIDLRLRPSGNSGLLVSTIDSFADYQLNDAWTWEHQALVRSRGICGSVSMKDKFSKVRKDILCQNRPTDTLQTDVLEMRDKMRKHLDKSQQQQIDLKQGKGAITDIEFLTQYWSLRNAHSHPQIVTYSDNVRIIEALVGEKLISQQWADALTDAYLKIRNQSHRKALQGLPNLLDEHELVTERENVVEIWDTVFGDI